MLKLCFAVTVEYLLLIMIFNFFFKQRKIYKDQAEMMLTSHVFPEFRSHHGYLRARVS